MSVYDPLWRQDGVDSTALQRQLAETTCYAMSLA